MPPSAHDFALKDMEFSNSSWFFMVKPAPGNANGKGNAANLFYPGCQLSASSSGYVEKAYQYLLSRLKEDVGIMLGYQAWQCLSANFTDLI